MSVPIATLFAKPTVAELADWMDTHRAEGANLSIPPLLPVPPTMDGRRTAPQSFAQQRLWFLARLYQGTTLYTSMGTINLFGELNVPALERTLTELVRRHESLRTTFDERDGQPIQCIAPPHPITLEPIDLRGLPADERQSALRRVRQETFNYSFDLSRGPLVLFQLILVDDQHQLLLIPMHHIITDGWSMGVLRREFNVLYDAFRADRPSPLPEPYVQYADYAMWQRKWLSGSVLEQQLTYWRNTLEGIENLQLPIDRPRPTKPRYNSARQSFAIDPACTHVLRAIGHQEEATLFMTLLAVFQVVLGRYAGQNDVVVGTPIANRTRTELEGVIGFFVNTLALRTNLSGNPSFRDVLRRARHTCLEAYAHQDLPFERLVEELAPERDLGIQPLFQVLFVLQNTPDAGDASQRRRGGATPITAPAEGSTYFDLTLMAMEQGDEINAALFYNTDLFEPETIQQMVHHLEALLRAVTDQPDTPLNNLSLLSESERTQLTREWMGTAIPFEEQCLHHLVEKSADQYPQQTAIVYQDRSLTYTQLDREANRLAHYLHALGVSAEVPVALCSERGPEAIVGLLAILKAGGVYVPIDPTLPSQRHAWLIEDARPRLILTQEHLAPAFSSIDLPVLLLDAENKLWGEHPIDRPQPAVSPRNLAYIIYTSGSTGHPKGVAVEHRNISHTIRAQIPFFRLNGADTQ